MSTPPGVLNAVRWTELCPWLLLVRAARAAFFVRMMALAVLGVWATQAGWSVVESAFVPAESPLLLERLTDRPAPPLFARAQTLPADGLSWQPFDDVDRHPWAGPLVRGWAWAIQPLTRLLEVAGWRLVIAMIAAGAWVMVVWAVIGGAMARMSALYLARDELMGPIVALQAGFKGGPSTFVAPTFCFLVLGVFVLLLMVAGFVMRLSFLAFLGAVLWPIAIAAGLALAILGLGLLLGWPFMWSTVAAERTDGFDAVSRGYAFVYQRPLHLAFYVLVATAIGLLCQAAVSTLVFAARDVTVAAVERGMGAGADSALVLHNGQPPAGERAPLLTSAGSLVEFWNSALESVATAFPMAYLFPAAMGIYLLQRRLIDSTELGEVALEDRTLESGLPPIAREPVTGVWSMAPAPPAGSEGAAPSSSDLPSTSTVTDARGGST